MQPHHLAFRTRDLARLRRFYQELLGLRSVREQAYYSVWLALGDAVLMLEQAEADEPTVPAGSLELLALRVDAQERARLLDQLRAGGVAIEDQTDFTSYFRDPDGRRIAISTYPLPELEDS